MFLLHNWESKDEKLQGSSAFDEITYFWFDIRQ